MIGGIFILGKRYHVREYLGVCLLAVGLIIFTVGDIRLLAEVNPLGIMLVFFFACYEFPRGKHARERCLTLQIRGK